MYITKIINWLMVKQLTMTITTADFLLPPTQRTGEVKDSEYDLWPAIW